MNTNKSVYGDLYWFMGLLSLAFGSMLNLIALGYGNQLVLASSSSLTIIHNTMMSVIFLNEKLYRSDMIAIFLMCVGSLIFVFSARPTELVIKDDEELLRLYLSTRSLMFWAVSFILILWSNCKDYQAKNKLYEYVESLQKDDQTIQIMDIVYNRRDDLKNAGEIRVIRETLRTPMLLLPLTTALLGGLLGSLFRGFTISFQPEFGFFHQNHFTYALFGGGLFLSFFQVRSFNNCIHLYNQLETIPTYESSLILMNMLSGAIIMQELSELRWHEVIMLNVGMFICIVGVFLIAKKWNHEKTTDNYVTQ